MAKEKGAPKTGGRKKGTPNKSTSELKDWISTLVSNNTKQIEKDLKELEPKDRLAFLEKVMQYIIPKAVKVEGDAGIKVTIEDQLRELAEKEKKI